MTEAIPAQTAAADDGSTRFVDITEAAAPDQEPAVFLPGELVATRYRIEGLVGRGGMGQVFAAQDLELGERIALKVIRPSIAARKDSVDQFRREVQLARKVTHRNVCRIFDLGSLETASGWGDGGVLRFLTMEWLPGRSLAEILATDGPLPITEAHRLLAQIATGLDTAHGAGVVHGDLKPANVMWIERSRRAVITDFGLARGMADIHGPSRLGATPVYTAPEVLVNKTAPDVLGSNTASRRSDIYSFGVLAGELLTGHAGQEFQDQIKELPEPWQRLVEGCREPRPEDRFATAGDALQALDANPPSPEEPRTPRKDTGSTRPFARLNALFAILGLTLLGLVFSLSNPGPTSETEPPKSLAAADLSKHVRPTVVVLTVASPPRTADPWLPQSLSEALRLELAASQHFRVIGAEETAAMTRDLALSWPGEKPDWRAVKAYSGASFALLGRLRNGAGDQRRVLELELMNIDTGLVEARARAENEPQALGVLAETAVYTLISGLDPRLEVEIADTGLPLDGQAWRLYSRGSDLIRRHRLIEAIQVLEEAARLAPDSPRIHDALAATWALRGHEQSALEAARRAFELAEDLIPEQRSLIEARYRELARDWSRAEDIYRSLRTVFPDHVDYGLGLASAQARAGRPREALATLEHLRSSGVGASEQIRLELAEAQIALARGHFPRAITSARSVIQAAGSRRNRTLLLAAHLVEGAALDFLGRFPEAKETFRKVAELASGLEDHASLAKATLGRLEAGVVETELGLPMDLEESLRTFRRLGSTERAIRASLLQALAMAAEDPEASRLQMLEALQEARTIRHQEAEAAALNYLALRAALVKDSFQAADFARRAVELTGEDGSLVEKTLALELLATASYRIGRYDQEREGIHRAIASDRRQAQHLGFGKMFLQVAAIELRTGHARTAIDFFTKGLEVIGELEGSPLAEMGLRARAYTFEIAGEIDRAEDDWQALESLHRDRPGGPTGRARPWRGRLSTLHDTATRTRAAIEGLERELAMPPQPGEPAWWREGIRAELAWAHLERAHLERAHLQEARTLIDSLASQPRRATPGLEFVFRNLQAQLAAAEGRTGEALDTLRGMRAEAAENDALRRTFLDLTIARLEQRRDPAAAAPRLEDVARRADAFGFHTFARQARQPPDAQD